MLAVGTRFVRGSPLAQDQSSFVDSFIGELSLPAQLPRWLWQGQPLPHGHPTIMLKVGVCMSRTLRRGCAQRARRSS